MLSNGTDGRRSRVEVSRVKLEKRYKPHFVSIIPGELSLGWRATGGFISGKGLCG
jgi:hypothetical protein